MENATKALLIAAGVLIAVLLIAFGIKIFNSTTGTTDSVEDTMDVAKIATFNNKFYAYVGTNKTKAQTISLLNLMIANNATNPDRQITITNKSGVSSLDFTGALNNLNALNDTELFTVEIFQYTNGYISSIKVYKQ